MAYRHRPIADADARSHGVAQELAVAAAEGDAGGAARAAAQVPYWRRLLAADHHHLHRLRALEGCAESR